MVFIFVFLVVIFYRANIERSLPKLETSEINTALRGNIITKDGFSITGSQKLYKVMVDTRIPIKKTYLSSFTAYIAATISSA